jgi:hypothetical protein
MCNDFVERNYSDSNLSFTFIQDRHANGQTRPLVDDEQDYNLHLAIERDDFTIFKFSRKLKTCDENDYEIHVSRKTVL